MELNGRVDEKNLMAEHIGQVVCVHAREKTNAMLDF